MREPFFCASNMKDDIYFDYHVGEDPPKTKTKERLWTVVIACLAAALGNFSVGYCIGYSSAAVVQLNNVNTTDVYLNKKETQWFVVRFVFVVVMLLYSAITLFCARNDWVRYSDINC